MFLINSDHLYLYQNIDNPFEYFDCIWQPRTWACVLKSTLVAMHNCVVLIGVDIIIIQETFEMCYSVKSLVKKFFLQRIFCGLFHDINVAQMRRISIINFAERLSLCWRWGNHLFEVYSQSLVFVSITSRLYYKKSHTTKASFGLEVRPDDSDRPVLWCLRISFGLVSPQIRSSTNESHL